MTFAPYRTASDRTRSVAVSQACRDRTSDGGEGGVKARYVAANKMQSYAAALTSYALRQLDNIRLQVNAVHIHLAPANRCQIMINGKGKNTLTAAKIAYGQSTLLRQLRINIVEQFEKAVYLSVFRPPAVEHPASFIGYSERTEERGVGRQKSLLVTVVCFQLGALAAVGLDTVFNMHAAAV